MRAAKVERVLGDVQAMVDGDSTPLGLRMPRRLETPGCVKASRQRSGGPQWPPTRSRSSSGSSSAWMGEYDHLVRTALSQQQLASACRSAHYATISWPSRTPATPATPTRMSNGAFCIASADVLAARCRGGRISFQTWLHQPSTFFGIRTSPIALLIRAIVHITAFLGIKREEVDRGRPGFIHQDCIGTNRQPRATQGRRSSPLLV
jgi:hypothetical protein